MQKHKRLLIFSNYNKDGNVYDYVFYLLEQFRQVADNIIVVVNGEMNTASYNQLKQAADEIVLRENKGFDGEAYREVLQKLIEEGRMEQYQELILSNDTYYGPFVPWKTLFDSEYVKKVDFWGLTKSAAAYYVFLGEKIPEHLQGYFLVIKRNMFLTKTFENFWKSMPKIVTYENAITYFEAKFTKYFSEAGFTYMSWMERNGKCEYLEGGQNVYLLHPYRMMQEYQVPILKRKAVSITNPEGLKALQYVEQETLYDVDMIKTHKYALKEDAFIPEYIDAFCQKHQQVYVYGYGKWAMCVSAYMKEKQYEIAGYLVTSKKGYEEVDMVMQYTPKLITPRVGIIIAVREYEEIEKLLGQTCSTEQLMCPQIRKSV